MRFYLIGAGVIAKEHANAIKKIETTEALQVSVADINPQALAEFTESFPHIKAYSNAKEMLQEEAQEDDIVVVCVPPFAHYEMSVLALNSGRHVVCEKPLTLNREEMDGLFSLANKFGKHVSCCSSRFVGLSKNEEIKQMIKEGKLGDIYKVNWVVRDGRGRPGVEFQKESPWFLDKSKSGGGILMDWGPYDFALLNDLLQPVKVEVKSAMISKPITDIDPTDVVYDIESHVDATLKYTTADGNEFILHYERSSCTHGKSYRHFEIEGTLGAVEWVPYWEADTIWEKHDKDGVPTVNEFEVKNDGNLGFHDHPIHYLYKKIKNESTFLFTNEQAEFNFSCILDIYDEAAK